MARLKSIDGSPYAYSVMQGYTQHVAYVFPGSPFEIIGDERVAHENGFTLHEYYCKEKNYTPGQVCNPQLETTLLNFDGAMTGFNYERDFMMMLGVEKDAGTKVRRRGSSTTAAGEFLELNGVQFFLVKENGSYNLYLSVGNVTYGYDYGTTPRHMFAVRGNESEETYYVYFANINKSNTPVIEARFKVDSSWHSIYNVFTTTSYLYSRLQVLAERNSCEVWTFGNPAYATVCQKFIIEDESGYVTRHDIIYQHMHVLAGKQPRKTLGDVITFEADGIASRLDANADSYADTSYPSSRSLMEIRNDLLGAVGLTPGMTHYSSETSTFFPTNPFAGMHGYTYRDFLGLVGESIGVCLVESMRNVVPVCLSTNVPWKINISCGFEWSAFIKDMNSGVLRNEYYTYDAEEYTVQALQRVVSQQTNSDIGTSYPDVQGDANTHIIVNNPLLMLDDVSVIRSRLSYIFSTMTGTYQSGYHPATIEMIGLVCNEPGDVISLTLEDRSTINVPIFCMTTTWNGGAECVVECTGDKIRNQYEQRDFKRTLKEGNKIHNLIVDIEQVYSEIMDTLTQDYSTTQQVADQISLYVGNHAYQIVSGISITSAGVTITGSKYISLESGYISFGTKGRLDRGGLRLKVQGVTDYGYYMRIGATGTVESDEVLNLGYEEFYDTYGDGLTKPSFTIRTKKSKTANEADMNIYSATNSSNGYDVITLAPWEHGQLGTSNRSYIGGMAWDYIYGNTINYVSLVQNSSRDIKHDINPLADMGDLIDRLTPVSFVYNADTNERKHLGLIFEDTLPVMPDICVGNEYGAPEDKSINYTELIPVLLKEIQSLRARVKELEQKT